MVVYRRLNHLNFGTINDLARKDLVRGLPRLKFEKDHLCSACQLGKSKKFSYRPKSENTNMEVLHTLHMDLCGPMRVQSINGRLHLVHRWMTIQDSHGSIPRTLNKNCVIEIRNRTLVEAANVTMMIFSESSQFSMCSSCSPLLVTPEPITNSYTYHKQNTLRVLCNEKKPDLTFFRVFGALCYPANDSENLGKFQAKADIGIFVGGTNHVNYPPDHIRRWTQRSSLWITALALPSRPVSTRKQLASELVVLFHTEAVQSRTLRTFKMVVIEELLFQAMQDEIHEFEST
ncbi:integrase, catalytic region, zinc finger, CCHC-type containing protein [Tanacetum coccineum]|uniref:Integrase, catalytic region, zinc finger, CCHC-type containing protein n=1 Tax=Tanacetum coccineum TaxID=301880 RepID=A0ABQ5HS38_9ASTR